MCYNTVYCENQDEYTEKNSLKNILCGHYRRWSNAPRPLHHCIDIIDLSLSKQGQSFWAPLKVRLRKTDFWHNIKYLDLKGIQCKELWWWWWSGCCVMTSGPAPDWQKLEKETADKGWDAALHLSTSSSATSQSKQKPPGKQATCRWLKWCCLRYLYNVIWLFLFDNLNVSWLDGGSIKRNHGAVLFIADNW